MIKKSLSIILIMILLISGLTSIAHASESDLPVCPKMEDSIKEMLQDLGIYNDENFETLKQDGSLHVSLPETSSKTTSIGIILPSGERISVQDTDSDIQKILDSLDITSPEPPQSLLKETVDSSQNLKNSVNTVSTQQVISQPTPELSMYADILACRAFVLLKDGRLMAYDWLNNTSSCLMENAQAFIKSDKLFVWTNDGRLWAISMTMSFGSIDVQSKEEIATDVVQIGNGCFLKSNGDLYTLDLNLIAQNVLKFANSDIYITKDHVLHYSITREVKAYEYTTESYQLPGFSDIYMNRNQNGQNSSCSTVYFAFSDDGKLYGWGDNSRGAVGCGSIYDYAPSHLMVIGHPTLETIAVPVYVTTPTEIASNIISIVNTDTGIYAWTNTGDLMHWGDSPFNTYAPCNDNIFNAFDLTMPDSVYCYPRIIDNSNPISTYINGIHIKEDGTLSARVYCLENDFVTFPIRFSDIMGSDCYITL